MSCSIGSITAAEISDNPETEHHVLDPLLFIPCASHMPDDLRRDVDIG